MIAQALRAASFSIEQEDMRIHSLHSYFLRPGDPKIPIIYDVQSLRDGGNFSALSVRARQKGKMIFLFDCSFQRKDYAYNSVQLAHQIQMPEAPAPETLLSSAEVIRRCSEDERIPSKFRRFLERRAQLPFPIDYRYCNVRDFNSSEKVGEASQMLWMKASERLSDESHIHQCVCAYASDSVLVETMLLPHGLFLHSPNIKAASLDHAMWFHEDNFRADEWILYQLESPRTSFSRGLSYGRMYDSRGRLIVSVAQEGLIRVTDRNAAPHSNPNPPDPKQAPKSFSRSSL